MNDFESLDDSVLMSHIAVGREDAVGPLIRRYERPLIALFVRLERVGGEADDLFQETWMRVVRSARSFDPTRPFRPWLFRIAWNVAKTSISRATPGGEPLETTRPLASAESGAAEELIASERNGEIRRVVASLPTHLAETIFLRFFEEMSEREVAARLGVPVGTVKSRLHNALRRLEPMLRKGVT